MGRDGWQISVLLPSDCKSDGAQGIPVLHFQGCLSNPQGATDGWQTDNLVSLTIFQELITVSALNVCTISHQTRNLLPSFCSIGIY